MRLIDAPVGLFLSKEGELCMKTEYIADWGFEAYIVRSGETYWGGAKTAKERNNLDVTLVDAVPVVRCRECRYRFKNNGHNKDGCPIIDTNIWMDDDDFCSHGERKEGTD